MENVQGKIECYNVLPLVHSGVQDSIVFKAGHAGLVCIELHNQPHARATSVFLSLGTGEQIMARNVVSWVFTILLGSRSSSVVNLFVAQQIWTGLVNVNLINSRFCWIQPPINRARSLVVVDFCFNFQALHHVFKIFTSNLQGFAFWSVCVDFRGSLLLMQSCMIRLLFSNLAISVRLCLHRRKILLHFNVL